MSEHYRGAATVATLRVSGRLLRLLAVASAGGAITILVLRALATTPSDLPRPSTVVTLAIVAVVFFSAAMTLSAVAERTAARVERKAVQDVRLTPEEREAERLRETPYLARQQRPRHPIVDGDE
ncbi:MAG: hypothetical protein ACRDQZ_19930 [Mycobacteriales bacterium]